jgi:hypothetical protein
MYLYSVYATKTRRKVGIMFWSVCDAKNDYAFEATPYEERTRGLASYAVLDGLCHPLLGSRMQVIT